MCPPGGGVEAVEHVARALGVLDVVLAVERLDAVAEHAMHAGRPADGAAAAARQIGDALGRADAHRRRIEQQHVGLRADGRGGPRLLDAVEIGGMAGEAADAFLDR